MHRRQGFTLIELLVVIAVIALLMAILMPALSKARDQGRTISCRANLKGYGLGLRMYFDDNDYRFPEASTWMKSKVSGHNWVLKGEQPDGVFWPYVKALEAHMCPKFSMLVKSNSNQQYRDTAVSYVMNSYVGNQKGDIWSNWLGANVKGVTKESQVHNASLVMVFTEENTWAIKGYSDAPFNDTHFTVGNRSRLIDNYATFHNAPGDLDRGGANLVFVDGHVDLLRRVEDPDEGFRIAWPKKDLPFSGGGLGQ